MWRVRCDETKVGTCTHQRLHSGCKVVGQIADPAGVEERNTLLDVEAVDDQVRISAIRLSCAIAQDDGAVVIDSGLRAKPAYHSCSSHGTGKRCTPGRLGFDSPEIHS